MPNKKPPASPFHATKFSRNGGDKISEKVRAKQRRLKILDVTMGQKWMQKEIREEFGIDGDYTNLDIREKTSNGLVPDIVGDSRNMTMIKDGTFDWVNFDPPFMYHAKVQDDNSRKPFFEEYALDRYTQRSEWIAYLYKTFREIYRVLKPGGICLLKWGDSFEDLTVPLTLRGNFSIEKKWSRKGEGIFDEKAESKTFYVWLRKPIDHFILVQKKEAGS